MQTTEARPQKHLTAGLLAVSFGVGYSIATFLPTVAMMPTISTADVARLGAGFGFLQMLGFLFFGFWTDQTRPLRPLKVAACIFLTAALAGFLPSSIGLWADRLLVGFGAGIMGSLLRTARRTAVSETTRTQQMGWVNWAGVLGGAAGTIFPVIGITGISNDVGRVLLNVFIALMVVFFTVRLPKMKRARSTPTPRPNLSLPIIILCTFSFFSAGAYAVFFLVMSKELVPNLSVPQTVLWPATATLSLLGAGAGAWLNHHRGATMRDTQGLTFSLLACALAYALPAFGYTAFHGNMVIVVIVAQLLAIVASTFGDTFWASLVSTHTGPSHQGRVLGMGLTVAAFGRMFWAYVMSEAIGKTIDWQVLLLCTMIVAIAAALLITTTASLLTREQP